MVTSPPIRRAGAMSSLVLAGLLLVTACGGGSSSSSSTTVASGGSSATTASGGSGGGSLASCAELGQKFQKALSNATPTMSASSASVDWTALVASLESLTSSMPSGIRDDWRTYVDAVSRFADAVKGVDMATMMSDPAAMQKFTDAAQSLSDAKYEKAVANISDYFAAKCPGLN